MQVWVLAQAFSAVRLFLTTRLRAVPELIQDLRFAPIRRARRRALRRLVSLMPEKLASSRSPEDWKRLRKRSLKEARKSIDALQYAPAIRLLSCALVEDPHYEPYNELLQQAAIQKRQRKDNNHRKSKDISSETSIELRNASSQLEAFCAYTSELTPLLTKAGFKIPQAGQKGKAR